MLLYFGCFIFFILLVFTGIIKQSIRGSQTITEKKKVKNVQKTKEEAKEAKEEVKYFMLIFFFFFLKSVLLILFI
jgi:galactokinase/mevalonate kinase-like predicted kinase